MFGQTGSFSSILLFFVFCSGLAAQSPKARVAYQAGLERQAAGKHAEAVAEFTGALAASRKFPAALRSRALSYAILGQDASALADLDQALNLKTDDLGAWNARGDLHLRRGELDAAAADFSHVLSQHSDPSLRLRRGTAYRGLGRYEEARKDLDLAIAANPNDPEAYYQRALASAAQKQWAEAEADLNHAIEHNPDFIPSYLERGIARVQLGSPAAAVADLTRYLQHAPDHSRALAARGEAQLTLGNKPAAEADLRKAVTVDPANEAAAQQLASLLEPEPAPAVAVAPAAPTAPPIVAEVKKVEPAPAPAVVEIAKVSAEPATPASPPSADVTPKPSTTAQEHNVRGRQLNSQDRYRQAIAEFDQAIKLDPALAQAFNSRGYAYLRLRRTREALADFNRAIELNPVYKNAHQNRGWARRALGDAAGADADLAKAGTLLD